MANTELIICDYKGCTKPFAYRNCGFNLCAEHCFRDNDSWWKLGIQVGLKQAKAEQDRERKVLEDHWRKGPVS